MSDGLPPGWQEVKDPSSGGSYFWNTETNATSWDRPTAGPPGPPPPPPGGPSGGGDRQAYGASDVFSQQELVLTGDAKEWCTKHEVHLAPGCPEPFTTFEAAGLPPQLLGEFKKTGFPGPSPIQGASWPPAMKGMDVVGIAKTGSGKTLGFLVPAFVRIMAERKNPQQGCAACLRAAPAAAMFVLRSSGSAHHA